MTPLKALPAHAHPQAAFPTREDLRWVEGVLHIVHDDLTPEQAHVADVVLIADALAEAGIDPRLMRHDRGMPVIVVDAG